MSYGLTPSGNPLQNQLMLDQSAALQGQTRQNALNALSRGVTSLSEAPVRQGMQQNALAQSNAATRTAELDREERERAIISDLVAGVERAPEQLKQQAWSHAYSEAERMQIDMAGTPRQYDPEFLQILQAGLKRPGAEIPASVQEFMFARDQGGFDGDFLTWRQQSERGVKKPSSLQQRALDAGLKPGTEPYKQFMLDGGRQKTSKIVYGQDGNPIVYEGAADGAPKPLREFEAKAVQFNTRMIEALPRVEASEKAIEEKGGVSIWDQAASSEMGKRFGGNFLTSNEFQTYQGAAREWIAGLLRLDSGAAVPETEFVRYFSTFFYEAGDNEKTRANKRSAREATMKALQQIVPPDRQGQKTSAEPDGAVKSVDQMTEEELAAEAKRLGIDY